MNTPLPPTDPNYRKPRVEHDRFGNVAVYRVQHVHGQTERFLVGRLAPDEVEALRQFLDAHRACPESSMLAFGQAILDGQEGK